MTPTEQEIAAHKAELRMLEGAVQHYERMRDKFLGEMNVHLAAIQQLEGEQRVNPDDKKEMIE